MVSALYSREILRLATSIDRPRSLASPGASVEKRSPTCGSRVRVDVSLDLDGRVRELAIDVSACALGQASAALMSAHAVGRTASELGAARDALRRWLGNPGAPGDDGFWPGIGVFGPARDYPARHPSILLAFEAVADAAERAK